MCPEAIKNYSNEIKLEYIAFWFLYTAPAVNLFRGCGLSNKAHLEFLLKKAKVLVVHLTKMLFHLLYITYKTECLVFISGGVVRVAKHSKQDWVVVL